MKFCYFLKLISWFASFSMLLEGGCNVPRMTRSTPGGFCVTRGDRGAGVQLGGDAVEDFSLLSPSGKPVMIEPIWKEASV